MFEVKEGWKPLCKFLNLPEPKESFPHVNDSVERSRLEKKLNIVSNFRGGFLKNFRALKQLELYIYIKS